MRTTIDKVTFSYLKSFLISPFFLPLFFYTQNVAMILIRARKTARYNIVINRSVVCYLADHHLQTI